MERLGYPDGIPVAGPVDPLMEDWDRLISEQKATLVADEIPQVSKRCGCCGEETCVCDDRDFESCVCDRDRDSIIALISERRRLEKT